MVEAKDVVGVGKHQYGTDNKEHVANYDDAPEAADGYVAALVALLELHKDISRHSHGEHIGSPRLEEQVCSAANNYHDSAQKKYNILYFIQLFHRFHWL